MNARPYTSRLAACALVIATTLTSQTLVPSAWAQAETLEPRASNNRASALATIRRLLADGGAWEGYCFPPLVAMRSHQVTNAGIAITCTNQQTHTFRYDDERRQPYVSSRGPRWRVIIGVTGPFTCMSCVPSLIVRGSERDTLPLFLEAWEFLSGPQRPTEPTHDAQFLAALEVARGQGIDRSEEMRRAHVQAQSLLEANRPEAALEAYYAATEQMPHWAEGHFNAALVAGRLEFYADAITSMRRFLYLTPNDPEARVAQDQIYEWEALLAAQ